MSYTETFQNDIRAKANLDFIQTGGAIKIVPSNPAAARTYTLPDAGGNDTFVFQAMSQLLGNKTLSTNLAAGGFLVTGLGTAAASGDSVSLAVLQTLKLHAAVDLATAAALPSNTYSAGVLTATANAALTVDGVAVTTGMRILVTNEATTSHDGIYTVTNTGSGSAAYVLTRATDFNSTALIDIPTFVLVAQGSTNAGTCWFYSNTSAILDTTSTAFTKQGSSISLPLSLSNGGTGGTNTAAAGAVAYSNASQITLNTPQGSTAGVPLVSGTSGTGAPTFSALNLAGGSSIVTGNLPLTNGGTNASLTAAAGAVAYSTASAVAFNTPQGSTAGVPLVSGTSGTGAPSFSALNLAGGSSIVTGNLPLGNGGTNAAITAAAGAVAYSTASALALTAAGTSGAPLISAGTSAPSFTSLNLASSTAVGSSILPIANGGTNAASASAGLTNLGGLARQRVILAKSANYNLASTDDVVNFTTGSSTLTSSLPTPSGTTSGIPYRIRKVDSGTGSITVSSASGNINGLASWSVDNQYDAFDFENDGTNYWIC